MTRHRLEIVGHRYQPDLPFRGLSLLPSDHNLKAQTSKVDPISLISDGISISPHSDNAFWVALIPAASACPFQYFYVPRYTRQRRGAFFLPAIHPRMSTRMNAALRIICHSIKHSFFQFPLSCAPVVPSTARLGHPMPSQSAPTDRPHILFTGILWGSRISIALVIYPGYGASQYIYRILRAHAPGCGKDLVTAAPHFRRTVGCK